jgi:ubiquinone biosynthesis accessory factor UbiK
MQHKLPFIETLSQKLAELLKDSPARDFEANLKSGLSGILGKLDLVTREEFDVQAEVLRRTKAQLSILETRLTEMEGRVKTSQSQD